MITPVSLISNLMSSLESFEGILGKSSVSTAESSSAPQIAFKVLLLISDRIDGFSLEIFAATVAAAIFVENLEQLRDSTHHNTIRPFG